MIKIKSTLLYLFFLVLPVNLCKLHLPGGTVNIPACLLEVSQSIHWTHWYQVLLSTSSEADGRGCVWIGCFLVVRSRGGWEESFSFLCVTMGHRLGHRDCCCFRSHHSVSLHTHFITLAQKSRTVFVILLLLQRCNPSGLCCGILYYIC